MNLELESFGTCEPKRMHVSLPLAMEGIEAGFPAPNGGCIDGRLDINEFLVNHPNSTFIYAVHGESMVEAGIMPGDYVLVDTTLEPRDRQIVVASIDGEFTIKKLLAGPPPRLVPCNKNFSAIELTEFMEVKIIGPVISVVRKYQ